PAPDASEGLADRVRAKDAGRPASCANHGLGLEQVGLGFPNAEPESAGDPAWIPRIRQQMRHEDSLVDVAFAQRLLGRLGYDRLVGLAVDQDLPPTLSLVAAVLRLEKR